MSFNDLGGDSIVSVLLAIIRTFLRVNNCSQQGIVASPFAARVSWLNAVV